MSNVGGGFGAFQLANQIQRKPINPYDKTTIVSVYPKKIVEDFITIFPGHFEIEAAPLDGFSLTIIEPSSAFRFMGEDQPFLEIPVNSYELANSIIMKFAQGLQDCNMSDRMPGLFLVPGSHDHKSVSKFVDKNVKGFDQYIKEARTKQLNWFKQMVSTADSLWARTNGNPLTISDDARMAAEILKLDKSWMNDIKVYELSSCPACGTMVNMQFPICSNCKTIINKDKAKELGLEFAK